MYNGVNMRSTRDIPWRLQLLQVSIALSTRRLDGPHAVDELGESSYLTMQKKKQKRKVLLSSYSKKSNDVKRVGYSTCVTIKGL